MKHKRSTLVRFVFLISLIADLPILASRTRADSVSCGGVTIILPFTDVMANFFFCRLQRLMFQNSQFVRRLVAAIQGIILSVANALRGLTA